MAEMVTVTFEFDFDKTVAALLYLADKPENEVTALDKYKASKLLFFADKYHLVRYGRPILGDFYKALPYGPVPQLTLNGIQSLLDKKPKGNYAARLMDRLSDLLEIDRTFANPRLKARQPIDISALSESDLEALEYVVREYGRKTFEELMALTHLVAPYRYAWESREPGKQAAIMKWEDFFVEDANAVSGAKELMLENFAVRKTFPAKKQR
jgi:uncharacterized phage-associated protein